MKRKFIFTRFLFLLITNLSDKISSLGDDEKRLKERETLFTNYSTRSCKYQLKLRETHDSAKLKSYLAKQNLGIPVPNKLTSDRFEARLGRGDIGYFFDYIDPVFKQPIFNLFTKIWTQANNYKINITDNIIKDEYDLIKIMNSLNYDNDPSVESSSISLEDPVMQQRIKSIINKDFDLEVYNQSINMIQLNHLINIWKYADLKAKDVIDKFDMDGDGRLNVREFLLFTILLMKDSDQSSEVSYNLINKKLTDPLYKNLDCEEDEYLSTKEFFEGLKYIQRPTKLYDIYYCKVEDKAFHSTAINEFILKHNKFKTGKLLIDELRRGILLGYWDRMTTKLQIKDSDDLSEKNLRWKQDGKIDTSCEEINEMMSYIT